MSELENAFKQMIREVVLELMPDASASPPEPELITIQQVTKMTGCDESVIQALHRERDRNGFPSVQLGARTIRIDRRRLLLWLERGGLNSNGEHNEDRRRQVQGPGLKAVPRAA